MGHRLNAMNIVNSLKFKKLNPCDKSLGPLILTSIETIFIFFAIRGLLTQSVAACETIQRLRQRDILRTQYLIIHFFSCVVQNSLMAFHISYYFNCEEQQPMTSNVSIKTNSESEDKLHLWTRRLFSAPSLTRKISKIDSNWPD